MFRKKPPTNFQPEWMIVGLGNPGPEYRGTRHNVGFEAIDLLAARHRIKLDQSKHRSRYGIGVVGTIPVLLVNPLTYMNLSGQAVAPLAKQFGVAPERILVIADDLALQVGRTRLKPKGSAGGHNGHKSLIASLGTTEYPRLKIGIGSGDGNTVDHVLGKFAPSERDLIAAAIGRSVSGAEAALEFGIEAALNVVNLGAGPES